MTNATTVEDRYEADEFDELVHKAVGALLQYGLTQDEILVRLALPKPSPTLAADNVKRILAYQLALQHWLAVGYSYTTARALAAVKHGQDADVRKWAEHIMLTRTNLKHEDMI